MPLEKENMENAMLFKFQLGDWTIWSISDGYLDLNQRIFFDQDLSIIQNQLRKEKVEFQEESTVRMQVNAYLIDTFDFTSRIARFFRF